MIIIEDVTSTAFEDYLSKIKNDFNENVYEVNSEDITSYTAVNEKNVMVYLNYEISDEILTILVSKARE